MTPPKPLPARRCCSRCTRPSVWGFSRWRCCASSGRSPSPSPRPCTPNAALKPCWPGWCTGCFTARCWRCRCPAGCIMPPPRALRRSGGPSDRTCPLSPRIRRWPIWRRGCTSSLSAFCWWRSCCMWQARSNTPSSTGTQPCAACCPAHPRSRHRHSPPTAATPLPRRCWRWQSGAPRCRWARPLAPFPTAAPRPAPLRCRPSPRTGPSPKAALP